MLNQIIVKNARVHNLKSVNLELPRNQMIVFTGISGSGKSSLAFDTIYAEGQRRYVESLSAYARQFLDKLDKPDVESISGLSPAISIDQKSASHNPRSTVGTVTEIMDYLRLLYASIGQAHCYQCGRLIQRQSLQEIFEQVMNMPAESPITILAPVIASKKGEFKDLLSKIQKDGFHRIRLDGTVYRLDEFNEKIDKNKKHTLEIVVDRLTINSENEQRIFESLETALTQTKGLVQVQISDTVPAVLFSENFNCPNCNLSIAEISPRLFSFNSPYGACEKCNGLGERFDFDPNLIIEDYELPIRAATRKSFNLDDTYYGHRFEEVAHSYGFSLETTIKKLTTKQFDLLMYGNYEDGTSGYSWEGIIPNLKRRYYQTQSEGMRMYFRSLMSANICPDCQGQRLKKEALAVKISDKNIADISDMSISALSMFIRDLKLTPKEKAIAHLILKEIIERLGFLQNVGLDYLSLSRKSLTLSGGEFQRIRLATQIGSGLTGVLYVLDEPSIGLHQRDNLRLITTLQKLKELGNTLIIVEHDEEMIRCADYVVDIGPGAGKHGGEIIFAGTVDDLLQAPQSLTGQYLNKTQQIEIPSTRRKNKKQKYLKLFGAHENNLKNLDIAFPLGKFICITGVSGSGKSSLVNDVLHKILTKHFYKRKHIPGKFVKIEGLEYLDKVITIDQSPIGKTPRSNPATYTNTFTPIRELFAMTRDAKIRGYKPGRFSFNVKGGRCEACQGGGAVKIEMHFLPDVYVTCDVCKGERYNEQTLEVKYKGYNINDVLNMTVEEASEVFTHIPQIANKLKTLLEVGLGYITLGQSAITLSGGEAQRIKLAKELSKRSTGQTLYLLDEPTTGLHFEDIKKLLKVLHKLVDTGNTVIVIEHNLDVIKTTDYIIDLGPEGGDAGGYLIAAGTPEEVALIKTSYTGQFLAQFFELTNKGAHK
ncbi:excinuclease ABC subunit UvrA [bacterium]|nr:excinuclease ABC subunit UvrA [bacterium]MBT4552285.1 excinuclease ABC subunit UvrA [bacterium]